MKSKVIKSRPIFIKQKDLQNTIQYIKNAKSELMYYLSKESPISLLKGLVPYLNNLLEQNNYNSNKFSFKKVYSFESMQEAQQKYSPQFIAQANALLLKGNVVATCGAAQFVALKNNKLKELSLSNSDYKFGRISLIDKIHKFETCLNHSKSNCIFVIDGHYDSENKYVIPAEHICGVIDFAKHGEIYVNPHYVKSSYSGYNNLSAENKDYTDYENINFQVPANISSIKSELLAGEDGVDVILDVFFKADAYLSNLYSSKRLNEINDQSFNDNMVNLLDYINLTTSAWQDINKEFNESELKQLSNKYNEKQIVEKTNEGK